MGLGTRLGTVKIVKVQIKMTINYIIVMLYTAVYEAF